MSKGSTESVEKEVRGVAESLVSTLGLVEIVLGGLLLYLVRLRLAERTDTVFPSTGYPVIDIGLLACVASLVGRVIGLMTAVVMAVVNIALRKTRCITRLKACISDYERHTSRPGNSEVNAIEYGAELVIADVPQRRSQLDRVRATAILSYAAGVLALPYATTLSSASPTLALCMRFASVVLLIVGLLQQIDYVNTISTLLVVEAKNAAANSNSKNGADG